MKGILFLFSCMIVLQGFSQKEFKGGILFGPVTTQISGDGLGGWDKFGFTGGAWVNAPVSETFGVSLSIKYITKGSRTKMDTLTHQSFGYYLQYIDVPVLLNYRSKKVGLNIGPYFGYLLRQQIMYNGDMREVPLPQFRNYDIGAQVGVSYWPGEKLFFEFDISSSVIPTRPNPSKTNPYSYYEKGNYNQVLQLLIGLRFGGGSGPETGR